MTNRCRAGVDGQNRLNSAEFERFSRELLEAGLQIRFQARGASMSPAIRDGEVVHVKAASASSLRTRDIVLVKDAHGLRLHRLIRVDFKNDAFVTRGDCGQQDDPMVRSDQILGVAVAKEVRVGGGVVTARFSGWCGPLLRWVARGQFLGRKVSGGMWKRLNSRSASRWSARSSTVLCVMFVLGVATSGLAQVVFQGASAPVTGTLTTGTNTVTVTQTIPAQTNGLLVICVSMNNQQSPTSTVTTITDNGSSTGIFNVGTVNSSPIKSRVEIWALKTPPTGLNTIVITIPVTAPTVGVVAASADFSAVNQTAPFETFGSATGSGNGVSPTVTVTSAAGEVVIDTVAAASPVTLTAGTGQVQEWQTSSGASTRDTEGAGSIKAGSAATATMTWTHTGATTWAIGAVSIKSSIVTSVAMGKLEAYWSSSGTLLRWQSGRESHNLGFNVYQEQGGARVRKNPSLIAGSALLFSRASPQHSGRTYSWIDSSPGAARGPYWIEDVDVNGTRTMHGPVSATALASGRAFGEAGTESSPMFSQLNRAQVSTSSGAASHLRENLPHEVEPSAAQRQKQFELAAQPAVKIFVKHEGWHRITQPELLQAGLDPNVDPAQLHLYAEAVEQPIMITGASAGPGGFGAQASVQFYGMGIDTQYSGTRVYWLVSEHGPGKRIYQLPASTGSNQPTASYRETVELTPHTTYFAALITTDGNNFFGPLISSTAIDETVNAPLVDKNSSDAAALQVILQGVTLGSEHNVTISMNGTSLGNLTFTGQEKGNFQVKLPPGLLQSGDNTITLTAQGGQDDASLLQSIRIDYPRLYRADSDRIRFSGRAGDEVKVAGFTSSGVIALDITNPDRPVELTPELTADGSSSKQFTLQVQVPWSGSNSAARHTLLAVASDRYLSAVAVRPNHPSHWHRAQPGSEIVMVTPGDLADALAPLVQAHRAEGKSTAVVPIEDLFDEFNFGERSPDVIREFLRTATKAWQTAPHYLLLNGRASIDPRNYLGFGHLDLVPTKIVPTASLMTASDDWFSDFNDAGIPTIATGRFPVTTPEEAALVAGKVATYEGQSTNGPWTSQALMVADVNDVENFTNDIKSVQAQLPKSLAVTDVFATTMTVSAAQQQIVSSINAGQLLVDYAGHGSEEQWSGDDLFGNKAAEGLTNGSSLPVFLIMNCLNGLFQDVYEEPLGVTLMLVPNGGAVAVVASSGLNEAAPQTMLDKVMVQHAMHDPRPALGDAVVAAKAAVSDIEVRKTFNLLGDPAMRIKSANPDASQ